MRGNRTAARFLAKLFLLFTGVFALFPTAVFADEQKAPPPEEPYEKVLYIKGAWNTEYVEQVDKTSLIVSYRGSREIEDLLVTEDAPGTSDAGTKSLVSFKLKEKSLFRGLYIPFTYPAVNPELKIVSFTLKDGKGNIYGPYQAIPLAYHGKAGMIQNEAADEDILISVDEEAASGIAAEETYIDQIYNASQEIVLPPGSYTLFTNDDRRIVRNNSTDYTGAVLIKGISYKAWQSYKTKLLEWEQANNPEPAAEENDAPNKNQDIAISVTGSNALYEARDNPDSYSAAQAISPEKQLPADFVLEHEAQIDEIAFNTYNQGNGAQPGTVTIADQNGQTISTYQAYGGILGEAPNGMWIISPGIALAAGSYTLTCSDMSVITYDDQGVPDFYVTTAPVAAKPFDFTGRYRTDIDVYKTSTLMGPSNENSSSFSLKAFELSVLDKGETIEVIGQYEGMPFSQVCEVSERQESSLKANFNFNLNTSVPYKAQIGISVLITLENPSGLQPKMIIEGNATYNRAASKDKGADFNTYRVAGGGSMLGKELPAFVMTALGAKMPSAGNIPGPDSPAEAAAGALFPPLGALVVHVLQALLKPKENAKLKLSIGEQAMADANQSLGKGLYDEKEAKAWAMLGDALANSDEPDADPYSIGDNEKPGGQDYVPPSNEAGLSEYGNENQENISSEGNEDSTCQSEQAIGSEGDEISVGEDSRQEDSVSAGIAAESYPMDKVFGSEREKLEAERDEYMKNLETSVKSADPDDPRSQELHQQYKDCIDYVNEKISVLEVAEKYAAARKMTVQVDQTGRTQEIFYDSDADTWRNSETGSEFNMNRYEQDVLPAMKKDSEFILTERHRQEARDTAFDKAMDALVNENKQRAALLGQLQKIRNESYGITPPAKGVGDVQANIEKLIGCISDMNLSADELREKAVRIAKVVTGRNIGRTMSEEAGRKLIDREMSYTKAAAQTITEGMKDVVTGRTWAGMAGRTMIAVLTGGASEYVLSPAEALMDIKESIDNGESGTRATLKAIGKYALGELGGEYAAKALKKTGLSLNPDFVKKATDLGNTPVSKVYSKYLGESGSKKLLFGTSPSAGKSMLGSADLGVGRNAPDFCDYAKYKTDVKNQANVIQSKIQNAAPNRPLTPEDVTKALSPDDIRQVLRDPSVSRELKNMSPKVQNAYKDALDKNLYNPAKDNTSKHLEKDLMDDILKEFGPDAKVKVEVESIRTPGTKSSPINADNDLTGKMTITDVNGRTITREIPAGRVSPIYNEKFAEAAGMMKDGKFDVAKASSEMPEGITVTDASGKTRTIGWEQATREQQLEAFAKKHYQEVTDVHSAEAAVDFNSAKNADHISNVAKLKTGDPSASLADPGGLAKMEQYKITNCFNKGGIANQTEAYEQLSKMGKLTDDLSNAYQKLGYNVQGVPEKMQKALEVVSNRNLSPGARTMELQKLGFDGPGDLANKLSGRIEGLQKLGQAKPGSASNKMVQKISSGIIRSFMNDH
ncbi:MAG: hypothetical protein KBA53_03690 [Thermoclostridium sp.]|nr:hypothetical protein [Thermoclostridium sp.]